MGGELAEAVRGAPLVDEPSHDVGTNGFLELIDSRLEHSDVAHFGTIKVEANLYIEAVVDAI